MGFQPGANLNTVAFGNRPEGVEVPHIDTRAPGLTDVNYPLGKTWVDKASGDYYVLGNFTTSNGVTSANWAFLGSTTGDLDSLTTDDATVVTPTAGTIILTGNSTQGVSTSGSNSPGTATITVADWTTSQKGVGVLASDAQAIAGTGTTQAVTPHALQAKIGTQTAHGVAMGSTGATAALSWSSAGTAGQAFISGGAGADGAYGTLGVPGGGTGAVTLTGIITGNGTSAMTANTVTQHGVLIGGASNAASSLGVASTGTVLMGATGADPAFTATPSGLTSLSAGTLDSTTTITAGTTLTATLGDITATNGNFVSGTSGKGLLFNSPTASGAASGPVVCNGRSGSVTFTSVSIAAAADLTLTITNSSVTASTTQVLYSLQGATTGSALSIKSVTNSSGSSAVVVTNGTGATTTTADITLVFLVLNA